MRETRRANKDGKLLLYPEGKPAEPHYVITAWNPGGLKHSAYDNSVNQKKLYQKLTDSQALTGPAEIFDSEKSWRMSAYYVIGLGRDQMIKLARAIGQNVFYFVDEEGQKKTISTAEM